MKKEVKVVPYSMDFIGLGSLLMEKLPNIKIIKVEGLITQEFVIK